MSAAPTSEINDPTCNHLRLLFKIPLASSLLHQLIPSVPGNRKRSTLCDLIVPPYPGCVGVA